MVMWWYQAYHKFSLSKINLQGHSFTQRRQFVPHTSREQPEAHRLGIVDGRVMNWSVPHKIWNLIPNLGADSIFKLRGILSILEKVFGVNEQWVQNSNHFGQFMYFLALLISRRPYIIVVSCLEVFNMYGYINFVTAVVFCIIFFMRC